MDGGRDHLLSGGPFDHADDVLDPPVDLVSTEIGLDERLADRLQGQRAELFGGGLVVELAERTQGEPDVGGFLGRTPVLHVIGVRMPEVRQTDLIDRGVGANPRDGGSDGGGGAMAVGEPLGDEAVILGPALRGVVRFEVVIPPVESHDGPTRWPVVSIRRDAGLSGRSKCEHDATRIPVIPGFLSGSGRSALRRTGILTQGFGET
jgi:hypothetical protein